MRRLARELTESVRIAFSQIWAHKLRSALTALGVIIGIAAVTLMGTAIHGIDLGFNANLAMLGDNVFYVQRWPWFGVSDWWNYIDRPAIRTEDAWALNQVIASTGDSQLEYAVPAAFRRAGVKFGSNQATAGLMGTTEGFVQMLTADYVEGRFFNRLEDEDARPVCILGHNVADALFADRTALDRTVMVAGHPFVVIGVLAEQGSFLFNTGYDNNVILPLSIYRKFFRANTGSTQIRVMVKDTKRLEEAKEELEGAMRRVRGQLPGERDNFSINEEEAFKEQLGSITGVIALAGLFVTGLALFVGAIGIMNITFVSVKERTKEIGTRKALGARRRTILLQFLIEAVAICLVGGLAGLGLTGGLAMLMHTVLPHVPLVFSPGLVAVSLVLATATGVIAGFAPAVSASRLDPVVALRYE